MKSEALENLKENAFFEHKFKEMEKAVKSLQFENAELVVKNDELRERCKTLASRKPFWPRGYNPKRKRFNERNN